ncbi:hypothetical protein JTE90_014778 [Oedothorax gibbosus]|uniref:Uncharacterized protein n=1 Tax=Oedothorax gibbosus TaxID=931172 RepID=A0AAV6UCS8_9ARAC|nr:hypothetical protein JTE90_014778 [Oedothorax gibbosus]
MNEPLLGQQINYRQSMLGLIIEPSLKNYDNWATSSEPNIEQPLVPINVQAPCWTVQQCSTRCKPNHPEYTDFNLLLPIPVVDVTEWNHGL